MFVCHLSISILPSFRLRNISKHITGFPFALGPLSNWYDGIVAKGRAKNNMPPLEQSLSSSHHSVGGSGSSSSSQRMFARVRHNLALSPSRNAKPFYHSTNHHYGSNTATTNFDAELRTAKDACVGAIMALLHYLSQHNIPSGNCVNELKQTIHYQYDLILRKIMQQYVIQLSTQIRNEEFENMHMLVLGCWQAQHRLAQVQYQRSYRYYQNLRFGNEQQQPHPSGKVSTSANLSFVTGFASPPLHPSPTYNSIPGTANTTIINGDRSLEKALQHQIQIAEYVCTCQKEMILCNRTYEYQQQLPQQQCGLHADAERQE